MQGRIQNFKLGGAHLKKLRRAEEGENILGVFRVKNHYFMPKNHSFYNYGGRREKFWGISCEKSRFYAKKTIFFSNFRGGVHPPPWIRPWNGLSKQGLFSSIIRGMVSLNGAYLVVL